MAVVSPGWWRRARRFGGLRVGTTRRGLWFRRVNRVLMVDVWSPRLDRRLRHWSIWRLEVWVGSF